MKTHSMHVCSVVVLLLQAVRVKAHSMHVCSVVVLLLQAMDIVHPWTLDESGGPLLPITTFSIAMIHRYARVLRWHVCNYQEVPVCMTGT